MAPKQKIGEYRHRPGVVYEPGPHGRVPMVRVRKRFPYLGLIPLLYGLGGSLVCAVTSGAFQASGLARYFPRRFAETPLPPAPSLNNVLFGAGLPETVLTCGLLGLILWRALWKTRLAPEIQAAGFRAIYGALLGRALRLGAILGFLALPLGAFGLYLRTAPANQPWPVRPFFGLLATPILTASALGTGTIPGVLLLLGLLLGLVTAAIAAGIWRQFPEEPLDL